MPTQKPTTYQLIQYPCIPIDFTKVTSKKFENLNDLLDELRKIRSKYTSISFYKTRFQITFDAYTDQKVMESYTILRAPQMDFENNEVTEIMFALHTSRSIVGVFWAEQTQYFKELQLFLNSLPTTDEINKYVLENGLVLDKSYIDNENRRVKSFWGNIEYDFETDNSLFGCKIRAVGHRPKGTPDLVTHHGRIDVSIHPYIK